jgi:type II secretory pathway component GspD/PulD (secretin)
MTRIARLLLIVALGGAVPAAAQPWLGTRVSLDLKAMAPAEAFRVLADAVGTKVTVDPLVTTPVDILVRNVSARTALTTICESIGCRWTANTEGITVGPGADLRVRLARPKTTDALFAMRRGAAGQRIREALREPLPAGFVCQNMPLATFSSKVSEAVKVNVIISTDDPSMQTVTGDFSNMTLQAVLKRLAEQEGGDRRVTLRTGMTEDGFIAIMVGRRPAPKTFGAPAPKK